MEKKTFPTELCYFLGHLTLGLGTAFMARADFGVSMVVAPAYILHLKISQFLPFFSFGMAEYTLQAVLLLLLGLFLRQFRRSYLFSFVTAVIYGFTLDGCILLLESLPFLHQAPALLHYFLGLLLCSLGISFFFHSYIPPEAYELFVKELSERYRIPVHRFKTGYDCVSCALSVLLSFLFFGFGHFEGVKLGTIFCALINGSVIGFISRYLEKHFCFRDALPLREYFSR